MARGILFVLLIMAVFASAVAVVRVRHENRQAFMVLQELERQRDTLQIEWGRLQLEYSTWADPARIERLAREQLEMRPPRADEVRIIHIPALSND